MSTARATQNHDEIKRWAESRGGADLRERHSGLLRVDFGEGKASHGREANLEQVE